MLPGAPTLDAPQRLWPLRQECFEFGSIIILSDDPQMLSFGNEIECLLNANYRDVQKLGDQGGFCCLRPEGLKDHYIPDLSSISIERTG